MSVLPQDPFDGQQFIDAFGMRWIYDANLDCWKRIGVVNSVPLGNTTNNGLLTKQDKYLLDRTHKKGGGFAIITKPHLSLRTEDNPDGVIFGDVTLTSKTLDIDCVFSDGREITPGCKAVSFKETDELPPGFDINYKSVLLDNLCVEVPGGPGPRGPRGDRGNRGKDGTGDGPYGLAGDDGKDAQSKSTLIGAIIEDVEDIFDTAVVKLDLDQDAGKLLVTKARMNLPNDDDDASTEQLIVTQVARSIKFNECFDFEIVTVPCREDDDLVEPDVTIAYYPSNFDPTKLSDKSFQPVKRKLSDMVRDMALFYQRKLDEISDEYDKQLEQFIKDKDKEARLQLDVVGDKLAECEHMTFLEYCLAPTQANDCGDHGPPTGDTIIEVPNKNPDCASIAEAVGSPDSDCVVLGTVSIQGNVAPVFSFQYIDPVKTNADKGPANNLITTCPKGCWIQRGQKRDWIPPGSKVPDGWEIIQGPGANPPGGLQIDTVAICKNELLQTVPCSTQQSSDWTGYNDKLSASLVAGKLIYKKTQLNAGASAMFTPGKYIFVYEGGAFRQSLHKGTLDPELEDSAFSGAFQDYWLGNEGNGKDIGQFGSSAFTTGYYILDSVNGTKKRFQAAIASSEIGLEIGFAPPNYKNLIPDDFFNRHAYNPSSEVGSVLPFEMPNPRTNFNAEITNTMAQNENLIQWKKFPTVNGVHTDKSSLENTYLNGLISNRIVTHQITTSGFFFARVKTAYSILNQHKSLVMPPVQRFPGSDFQNPGRDGSINRPLIELFTPGKIAFTNARPIADGDVKIRIIKVG